MLDAFTWHALTTSLVALGEGGALARRFLPHIAGFAALREPTTAAWGELADLAGAGATMILSGAAPHEPPDGWVTFGIAAGFQMLLEELAGVTDADPALGPVTMVPLDVADVPAIMELISLANPGPFRDGSIEFGGYVGAFVGGRLAAMAGRLLQTPDFVEVGAVCTHPSFQGRGLGALITHRIASTIMAEGRTPVLHVAEGNVRAQRVYRRLGFVTRCSIPFGLYRSPA